MSLDQATLGARLRVARENSDKSQEAAAEAIGVPRTAIVHIESGRRSVSTLQLVELAKLYNRDVTQFLVEDADSENSRVAHYRLPAGLEKLPEVEAEVARCLDICREGVRLEALLGRPPRTGPPSYALSDPRKVAEAVQQGSKVAVQERLRLGLGNRPIADLGDLLSSEGIWASGVQLPDEMSGLFLRDPAIGVAIVVNWRHHPRRKRFSYAHEYAHCLLDRDRSAGVTTTDNRDELIEKRANAFAAALLLPEGGVQGVLYALGKGALTRQDFPVYDVANDGGIEVQLRPATGSQNVTYQDVARIAHHFGVSYQASVYRLRGLEFIERRKVESLLAKEGHGRQYTDLLEMDPDEAVGHDDREMRRQVVDLAIEAYRRDQISQGKLRDLSKLLHISAKQLVALAEAAKGG